VVRNAVEVDAHVGAVIVERLSRPDALALLRPTLDTAPVHAEMATVRERLDGLAREYADGTIDARQMAAGSTRLRERLAVLTAAIADASRGSALSGVVDAPDVAAAWARLALDRKRAIVDTLVTVTILRSPKGRRPGWRPGERYFDPRTVDIGWKGAAGLISG
jgi:hypothetical protein